MREIFSHGGGTQSAAITVLIVQGRLPKPDFVVIVDTEREKASTWQYWDNWIKPALDSVKVPAYRVRKSNYATVDLFGGEDGQSVLMPAFSDIDGTVGKMSGYCSNEWKVRVMQRFVSNNLGVPAKIQKRWIGFSFDETRRAVKMMQGDEYKDGRIRFPLIHDFPIRRHQAIRIVESAGWPTPPRSACWMCPNQRDDEWSQLKLTSPAEFQAACDLEMEVQKVDPNAWLHKSCKPLGEVDFSEEPSLFDVGCDSGVCFL